MSDNKTLEEKIDDILDVHIDWIQGSKTGSDCNMKHLPYYLTAPFREKLRKQIISLIIESAPELEEIRDILWGHYHKQVTTPAAEELLTFILRREEAARKEEKTALGEMLCTLVGNTMLRDMELGKKLGEILTPVWQALKSGVKP